MKRRRKRKNNLGLDISSIEILCRRSRVTIDSCYLTRVSLVPFLTVQGGFLSKITEVLTIPYMQILTDTLEIGWLFLKPQCSLVFHLVL
ncbi:hypothetical protein OPQ81_006101 [Rhizoctonia solani]|nr:hypothetical protein OPQ81_006101 [Rhizoctonia solani]